MKLIRKPFKGNFAYELQIAMIVILLFHRHTVFQPDSKLGKIKIFIDPYWRKS